MRRALLIYSPAVVLLTAAVPLPTGGHDLSPGLRVNAHEFAVAAGLQWMLLCVGFRLVRAIVRFVVIGPKPPEPRGFDVMHREV